MLPGAGSDQAAERAEQLRHRVSAALHELDGEHLRVTASIGVAVCPPDGSFADTLLEAADRALYTAKASGRDRVVLASSQDPEPVSEPVAVPVPVSVPVAVPVPVSVSVP